MKFDVIVASSNGIVAKYWFPRACFHCGGEWGANCLSPIYSGGWLQDQWPWHARCQNIPFINNSMLCMFTSSLGRLINSLLHWWILQFHDGSQFFYRAISCNAEYYQLYWNGRELTLFNYRMIKCLCISCTYISINSFLWIFISACLPL